jgi:hypothetical protein
MEKCDIDLLLPGDSTKHALGRFDNVMIKLHMTFISVDFVVIDMRRNTSSPIILGRPFLRTADAVIDSKEGNVKCQFAHKKSVELFPRKTINIQKYKCPHDTCSS